jgi:hypothetical protein
VPDDAWRAVLQAEVQAVVLEYFPVPQLFLLHEQPVSVPS